MPEATRKYYTYSDMELFVTRAANWTARRYGQYGVEADDVAQEIRIWLIRGGEKKVRKWLRSSPQQTTRIYLSMLDIARGYAEREKAEQSGYHVEDVTWYSIPLITDLLTYAFDPTFTGEASESEQTTYTKSRKPPQEGNNLLVMVIDIRSALDRCAPWVRAALRRNQNEPEALQILLQELGGSRPYIGQRHVISNAHAQYLTKDQ